jgi:hypothetical protein
VCAVHAAVLVSEAGFIAYEWGLYEPSDTGPLVDILERYFNRIGQENA